MERLLTNFSHAYMGPSVPSHTYETKGKFKQRTLKSCIIHLSHYRRQPVFWMESIGCDCFLFLTIRSKHSGEARWWAGSTVCTHSGKLPEALHQHLQFSLLPGNSNLDYSCVPSGGSELRIGSIKIYLLGNSKYHMKQEEQA